MKVRLEVADYWPHRGKVLPVLYSNSNRGIRVEEPSCFLKKQSLRSNVGDCRAELRRLNVEPALSHQISLGAEIP
jgi:hypothetical protein